MARQCFTITNDTLISALQLVFIAWFADVEAVAGEGVTNRHRAGPPHPDRASAIRPLPERCRKLQDLVMIERHRDLR
jgi:hypothetical protein